MRSVLVMLIAGCGARSGEVMEDQVGLRPSPNILLVVVDDAGVDAFDVYPDMGIERPFMPTIDALAANGVVFDQAWSSPLCSPTRASLLTGRYPHRHGQGQAVADDDNVLADETTALPRVLSRGQSGLNAALFGKWHLGTDVNGPTDIGFTHFSGTLTGEVEDYYSYEKIVDGETVQVDNYATSEVVDDASEWINGRNGPWLAMVNFNAAHTPFHLPPDELHSIEGLTGDESDININTDEYFRAMLEAVDTELGRLLSEISPAVLAETYVIFITDNGSMGATMQGILPNSMAKSTLHEGGVHVPMLISGPLVNSPGRRESAIVSTMDLHATILDIAGVSLTALGDAEYDAVSVLPLVEDPDAGPVRDMMLNELFGTRVKDEYQGRAARDQRYKLIDIDLGTQHLYDLEVDPLESVDLLLEGAMDSEAKSSFDELSKYLASLPPLPPDE